MKKLIWSQYCADTLDPRPDGIQRTFLQAPTFVFHCAETVSTLDTIFLLCTNCSADLIPLMREQRLTNSLTRPNVSQEKNIMVYASLSNQLFG